ncbi:MAG: GerMN domain-containing protein [Lachnospiraceae bacterium]|nr:GerMN domain-containing protein [Lachnospiraceae bacterium]MDD3659561.1 GerMN domain-containing protein [Lachnospiraceae bacterium]
MKKKLMLLILLPLCLLLASCAMSSNTEEEEGTTYKIYYLDKNKTKLAEDDLILNQTDTEELIAASMIRLCAQPDDVELNPVIRQEMYLNFMLTEKQVMLNMSSEYKKLNAAEEVLARAAIVNTLTQIQGVDFVSITIEGEPLLDALGNPVGVMTKDMFINNAGKEMNSYNKVKMTLYFADAEGDGLIEINRTLAYQNNISMEKLVVEQVIAGPSNQDSYPSVNPETKVISATIKDGVCYVNLDESFLTQPYNVSAEVAIYSIVNSLVELSNVNKVQISVEGENDFLFREQIDLTTLFERNLDLLK